MELSTRESIRALMQVHGMPVRNERRRGVQAAARPVGGDRRMRCHCGQCRQCVDNARWERIFVEKFADPEYYTRPVVRSSSPLTSL